MMQAIIAGVTAVLIAVMMPVLLWEPVKAEQEEPVLLIVEEAQEQPVPKLMLDTGHGIAETDLETYLVEVVLSEMPASFALDALKAQAVAARTFTMRRMNQPKHEDFHVCGDSACCQAWTSRDVLEQKLGNAFSACWEKASKAVRATEGEVLYYGDTLIDAVYFSCSGGKTEDAVAVWGSDVPYLQSVESPGEENAPVFEGTETFSEEEFRQIICAAEPSADLSGNPSGWFGEVSRSDGGGVLSMTIGGISFSGVRLRSLLGLRSTLFTTSVTEDGIRFQVRGYGHRVGMSQYGANAMAGAGKSYREILNHYYTGAEIRKHP